MLSLNYSLVLADLRTFVSYRLLLDLNNRFMLNELILKPSFKLIGCSKAFIKARRAVVPLWSLPLQLTDADIFCMYCRFFK